jgi:hypothetical protein
MQNAIYNQKLNQCIESPPQIKATAPRIGTLFFTADTERPEEAPVVASKKSVPIEGYSG